jgi:solute carrier family 35 protein E1
MMLLAPLPVAARPVALPQRRTASPCIAASPRPSPRLQARTARFAGARLSVVLPLRSRRAAPAAARAESAVAASGDKPWTGLFKAYPQLETGLYFAVWYMLNVKFNILNKQIYNIFPFPWFVSCIHLVVGVAVMAVFWATKAVPFQKPDAAFWKDVSLPAFRHAFGHCLTNVSFAAVAVSFTHTVKTLEPVFSALGSYAVSGVAYPLPVYLALLPIMAGVALASATELSFTWLGFTTAMASNVAFAGRAIYSKNLMSRMSAVNLYNYVTIVALAFCLPPMLYFEGATLLPALKAVAAKVGVQELSVMLFNVGLYYHLYNQVAYQALEKVEPITHAVGNVGKRIFVIGFSIVAFGNTPSAQTLAGSAIAIAGAGLYSVLKAKASPGKH